MNITLMCNKLEMNYGDVTLKDIDAAELVKAIDGDGDLSLQEVLAAIQIEKGKEWFEQAVNELME